MFQKPLHNSLARANNKHCSLHLGFIRLIWKTVGWLILRSINVSYSVNRLGKPSKCKGSLVSGDSTEFVLVIVNWQTGLCGLGEKDPEVLTDYQPHWGIWEIFSQWCGGKQERGKGSYKESTLTSIQILVRNKEKLWPRPHHRNRNLYLAPCESYSYQACTVKWKSQESPWKLLMKNWTIPLSSAYCWWSQLYNLTAECTLEHVCHTQCPFMSQLFA